MVAPGIVAVRRTKVTERFMRRVIVIAAAGACLAGCSSVSFDSLKPAPSTVQVQLEVDAAGCRCEHVVGAELQDTLLGYFVCSRGRVLGYLCAEQVPAGDRSGAGHTRRFPQPQCTDDHAQSGGCGTSAGASPAEAGQENKAEKAEGYDGGGSCRIALPSDRPLIPRTAPDQVRIVRGSHRA